MSHFPFDCSGIPHTDPPKDAQEAQKRLEIELGDKEWRSSCPVCSHLPPSNRRDVFSHLLMRHRLNLGVPDEIIDAKELLKEIYDDLSSCCCICCQREFPSQVVLRKHMKHKGHYRISPLNPKYKRFFLSFYSDSPDDDNTEAVAKDKEIDSEGDEDETLSDMPEEEDEPTKCLFCSIVCDSAVNMVQHCLDAHGFDLNKTVEALRLTFYQTVKLINYIRVKVDQNTCPACDSKFDSSDGFRVHCAQTDHCCFVDYFSGWVGKEKRFPWDEDKYLFPIKNSIREDAADPLLYSMQLCGCVFVESEETPWKQDDDDDDDECDEEHED